MKRLFNMLSSWWLTALLVAVFDAVYASLSFGQNPWPLWTGFILHHPAGIALYYGLIVNILAASVRIVLQRLSPPLMDESSIRGMDSFREMAVKGNDATARITNWAREKGFLMSSSGSGFYGSRGRFSYLPGTALRLGIVLVLATLPVSAHMRQSERANIHEGGTVNLFGTTFIVHAVRAGLPEDFLQVGEESTLRLPDVSVRLTVGRSEYTITSHAPTRIVGLYFRIVNLGYAQTIAMSGQGLSSSQTTDLDILPPGKSAVVPLSQGARFLTFTLEPERTISKGLLTGRQYDLRNPSYRIVAQQGKEREAVQSLVLKPGKRGSSGGMTIALGDQRPFVTLEAVHDPALAWILIGMILTVSGAALMLSRFFWYEKRLCLFVAGNRIVMGYSEEFYKKWGVAKFQAWEEELEALNRL